MQIQASSPIVCAALRFSAKSRFWKLRERASALETEAATPSFTSSVIRISSEASTSLLYRFPCNRTHQDGETSHGRSLLPPTPIPQTAPVAYFPSCDQIQFLASVYLDMPFES